MRALSWIGLILALGCSQPEPAALLLGKWRSDEEATLAGLREVEDLSEDLRRLFEDDFFGKLEVTYRREGTLTTSLDGHEWTESFTVVGQGRDWVDVRSFDELAGEDRTRRIWIQKDRFHLLVETPVVEFNEYFERI